MNNKPSIWKQKNFFALMLLIILFLFSSGYLFRDVTIKTDIDATVESQVKLTLSAERTQWSSVPQKDRISLTYTPVQTLPVLTRTPIPGIKIFDRKNNQYDVRNVKAKYVGEGSWIGKAPTKETRGFYIVFSVLEDRITTEEELIIPFDKLRSFTYTDSPLPTGLEDIKLPSRYKADKNIYNIGSPVRFDFSDDSIILLWKSFFIQLDGRGNITDQKEFIDYCFMIGEYQNARIRLVGFSGLSETKEGKTGEFNISISDTHKIDFLQ